MAQILKEEVRIRIVNAATLEILENGFEKASMRKIARKAGVTVGNLYRYFDGKEALVKKIVDPALTQLNLLVKSETNNHLSLFSDIDFQVSFEEIEKMLRNFSGGFTGLFDQHYEAMMILMFDSTVRTDLVKWFIQLIKTTVEMNVSIAKDKYEYIDLMCEVYAISICSGITTFFQNYKTYRDKIDVADALYIYFDGFVKMVQSTNWRKLYE